MEAIRFEKVTFSYAAEHDDVFADSATFSLHETDFSIRQGEFVAVLGHNGSGKSTLARLINGLLTPTSGKITVFGLDATDESNLFEIRKQVGLVFQNPDNQTVASIVEDDIAFGPENIGVPREEIGARIDFALNAVGMSEFRYSTTSRLSGGQKQRVAIAGVLALKPRVMILDESTAMLDPRGRKEVMDVVLRLNKEENITVLLITHFPEEALLADRAVVMNHGKIVVSGTPSEVLSKESLLKECSLTLPKSLKICRELQKNGVEILDAFNAEDLAISLVPFMQAISNSTTENIDATTVDDRKNAVVCEHLSYTYNEASPFASHALNGVAIDVKEGDFFGIIGHTGSGKSTFVQHLNALIKLPTAEKKYKEKKCKKRAETEPKTILSVDGFDLTQKTTDFKSLRKKVGMVFQYPEYQLFAETVFEDVAFGLKNFNDKLSTQEIEEAVREAIERVGLCYDEIKNRSPFELSGGQKRRVAIAGVIVTKPEILVLDEPAAGLDPLGKEEIMSLLHAMHESWCKTVIIVSHDMDEIAENCNRVAVFANGKILALSSPKSLFIDDAQAKESELGLPFTAKLLRALKAQGVEISCDLTTEDLIVELLANIKTDGAGMRSKQGGQANA